MAVQKDLHYDIASGTVDYTRKPAPEEKLFWPAFLDDLVDANDGRAGGDIVSHDGVCADDAAAPNADASDGFRSRFDGDVTLDYWRLIANIFGPTVTW
jgi:hypothetical protein